MLVEITIALFLLLVLTLISIVDMAFSQISDVSLRKLFADAEESKNPRSLEFLREISANRPRFRFAVSSAIQMLLIIFSVMVVLIVYRFFTAPWEMFTYSILLGLAVTILFRQLIPRLVTLRNPESKLLLMLPLMRPIYRTLPVIADPFEPSFKGYRQTEGLEITLTPETQESKKDDDNDDIQALIEVGEAEGILEEDERELIEKMVEFGDTEVDEIMTPRTEIVALPLESTINEARDLMIEEKYSRLPVYKDNIDAIEGVIYVRDLLNVWANGKENQSISQIIRPTFFVPETKLVSELLKNMQVNHVQIAMVVDEYGGVAGLVTVEDILEEIVGEIEDEDLQEEIIEIIEGGGGYYDVLASTEIGKIERLFGIEIGDDDFTTIGGLVTTEAGYVPQVNEKLTLRGLELEILKAEDKRIQTIRIRRGNISPTNK